MLGYANDFLDCRNTMRAPSAYRTIWFRPAETITRIAHENPGYRLYALPIVAGMAILPAGMLLWPEVLDENYGIVVLALLSFPPLFEVLQLSVGGWLIRFTGEWLGGQAGMSGIKTALAWGNVPIACLAILGIAIMLTGIFLLRLFGEEFLDSHIAVVSAITIIAWAVQLVLIAWSFAIFFRGLAAVQGFSVWRAIINSVLAWSIPVALCVLVVIAFGYSDKLALLFFAEIDQLRLP